MKSFKILNKDFKMEEVKEYIDFLSNVTATSVLLVKLEALLNEIPLETAKLTKSLTILCNLITKCREVKASKDVLGCVVKRWDPNSADYDGIIGDLSATYLCSMDNLKYLASVYENSTPMSVLDSHIHSRSDSGMVFNIVANRVLEAYSVDNLEEYEWKQLVNAAEQTQTLKSQQHTLLILHYINEKLKIKNKVIFAEKPEWVSKPPESEDDIDLGSIEKITDNDKLIKEFMSNIKTEEVLPEEAISLALSVGINSKSEKADRIYGPINAIVGFDCVSKPGGNTGPCRMLYCLCKEFTEAEELGIDESEFSESEITEPWKVWFKGECEICHKSIRKFRYALRFPLYGGGFEGCFCSFECALKNPRPLNDTDIYRLEEIERLLYESGISDI